MNRRRPDLAALERQVATWNAAHPIGSTVIVTRDNGAEIKTQTRSEAWVMSGHSAVIKVTGISGCYSLDRVKPETSKETI